MNQANTIPEKNTIFIRLFFKIIGTVYFCLVSYNCYTALQKILFPLFEYIKSIIDEDVIETLPSEILLTGGGICLIVGLITLSVVWAFIKIFFKAIKSIIQDFAIILKPIPDAGEEVYTSRGGQSITRTTSTSQANRRSSSSDLEGPTGFTSKFFRNKSEDDFTSSRTRSQEPLRPIELSPSPTHKAPVRSQYDAALRDAINLRNATGTPQRKAEAQLKNRHPNDTNTPKKAIKAIILMLIFFQFAPVVIFFILSIIFGFFG